MSTKAKPTKPEAAERSKACDRIFNAACELFYRKGIRAVGVETIAEKAQATKMSLYRSYPSKDELVAEYLRRESQLGLQQWDGFCAQHPNDPRLQFQDLFAGLCGALETPDSRGCALANAAVELTDPEHPGRKVIEDHKAEIRKRLVSMCAKVGARDHDKLADALFLLLEGACTTTQTLGHEGPGRAAMAAAEALIEAYMPKERAREGA
jgi:AcrR family transcriptional regulator